MEEERVYWKPLLSLVLLTAGLAMDALETEWFQSQWVQGVWYVAAFCPVGWGVLHEAVEAFARKDYFSEFTLMSVAAVGAFAIGEYPEAVAVMLFYCVGEMLQDIAVDRAKDHIEHLVAMTPDTVRLVKGKAEQGMAETVMVSPGEVAEGDVIEARPGERVALDGTLLGKGAEFNTAALTGESVPQLIEKGGEVLAGMIASQSVVRLKVVRKVQDSALSRIMHMVEKAQERKAPAERFIRKFARAYTPAVMVLSVLVVLVPWAVSWFDTDFRFVFSEWFSRAMVFLVVSCPCALVVSVPLSYFAGIGKASARGILFKGGNYLEAMAQIDTVVFDKTGTLTDGVFAVKKVEGVDLRAVAAMEQHSNHPIAQAICRAASAEGTVEQLRDMPGYGLSATVNGEPWLVGTLSLLEKEHIRYPAALKNEPETIVACARNGVFQGYVLLADTLKEDAGKAVADLKRSGIGHVEILSGDRPALVGKVAAALGIVRGYGHLLPHEKVGHIERLKKGGRRVAFVGDGINDAPVLALSHVGIAMGGLGADMAIETADVVIRNDRPSKVAEAVLIGRRVHRVVKENMAFAIGVKILVMVLGVWGLASLWMAVFADVGVTLLCVLNAMRVVFWQMDKSGGRQVAAR